MIRTPVPEPVDVRRARLAELLRERNSHRRQFPMSFQQQGLWFVEQLYPGSAAYHVPLALRYAPARDPATLRSALSAVVAHHPVLRTTFGVDPIEHTPAQYVHRELPPAWSSGAVPPEIELAGLIGARVVVPFDLEQGPLLRAHLFERSDGDQTLLITLHHLVADGWSLHLLIRDLDLAYAALAAGQEVKLERPGCDYHDWAAWQHRVGATRWSEHLAFYRRQLDPAPPCLALPTDRPRPAAPTHRAGRHTWTVPTRTLAGLHAVARAGGTTLYVVLLSALAVVLHRWSGQRHIVIGTPTANRAHPALHGVIGYFVNTAVVPIEVGPDDSAAALMSRVHALVLSVLSYQDLPFERLVEALAPARTLAVHPVFQVMFALQNTPQAWATEQHQQPTGAAKFDLTVDSVEAPDGLHLDCVYAAELFDVDTVERVAAQFTAVLVALAAGEQA